jgi:hypothetical protein
MRRVGRSSAGGSYHPETMIGVVGCNDGKLDMEDGRGR